jgi:hypothetical protein
MLSTYRSALLKARRACVVSTVGLTIAAFLTGMTGCGKKDDAPASSSDGYGTAAGGSTTSGGSPPPGGYPGGGQTPGGG